MSVVTAEQGQQGTSVVVVPRPAMLAPVPGIPPNTGPGPGPGQQTGQQTGQQPGQQTGRRLGNWFWLVLALAVAAGGGLYWWQPFVQKSPILVMETVAPGPVTRVLAVNGQLAAQRSVEVRPLVNGTLIAVVAAEGDQVATGTVLARLDPTQQEAVVRQVTAALEEGRTKQDQALATFNRTRALRNIVSPVTLDDAANALASAGQEVGRLTAILDQARAELARYTIIAPIDGTIMLRNVDPGQVVDPSVTLFTVADLSGLIVETDVDEAYATQVKPGQQALLRLVGDAGNLTGRVSFVSPRVDPATGGLAVRIGLDAPLDAPAGLTVTANIIVETADAALTVPRTAVVSDGDGSAVFVFRDGKAVKTPVRLIEWPATRLVVTEGLSQGDALIVDATGVTDGQVVRRAATRAGR